MKNYLSGISGPAGLGKLPKYIAEKIEQNKSLIDRVLDKSNEMQGLGKLVEIGKTSKTTSFKENEQAYNQNISKEEKQAWVWWKRSIGIPMFGWEEYFLPTEGDFNEIVVTNKATTIKDNHFRDILDVPANYTLGKFIRKHSYSKDSTYLIVRSQEGLVYVLESACKIEKGKVRTSESAFHKLISSGALYYFGGELLPYPVYAYNNMYDRQLQLAEDKEYIIKNFGQSIYDNHFNVCHKTKSVDNPYGALPEPKSIMSQDIEFRPIITVISKFASYEEEFAINTVRDEYLDTEKAEDLKKVNGKVERKKTKEKINLEFNGSTKYSLQIVFCKWLFTLNTDTDFKKTDAVNIVDYYINSRPLRDDNLSKEEKSEIKANARNEGEELFQKFLHEVLTYEDQRRLDITWNRLYNGQSKVRYDKIPIGFECSRMFKTGVLQIKPMQREVIGFIEMQGSGVISLDVGGGKTMSMIILLAMGIMQGKFKRPLLVVTKPVYKQFIKEIIGYEDKKTGDFVAGVLSHTGIIVNEWGNLGSEIQRKLKKSDSSSDENFDIKALTKKVPEKSITVITKEGIKKLGYSQKQISGFLEDLVQIFENDKDSDKSERDKEKKAQSIREMIGASVKNSIADVDTLGFDALFADEAHNYKNVFKGIPPAKDSNEPKRYDLTGSQSEFGIRMFFLSNYIQRVHGRSVVLATATPFTKAILEIYSMLSMVALENLKRNNIISLKDFCDLFIIRTVEWVANIAGELKEKEVIKNFINADILRNLINNFVYYRNISAFTNVILPCKINLPLINRKENDRMIRISPDKQITTYLAMTPKQSENQKRIENMIKAGQFKGAKGGKALIFKGIAQSLDNALSPYLLGERWEDEVDFVESSPKIHAACMCIKSVKEWCVKNGEDSMPGQIIYANRAVEFFPVIKKYLNNKVGFKTDLSYNKSSVDEVELITGKTTEGRKEIIQSAFNEGVCKVIIGTATIQEGLNLQGHATDIYVIQSEWNPTSMVQLAGRIHRQGNPYGYIRFTVFLVQDSVDIPIFQKNEEKISRINELLEQNGEKIIDSDTLDAEEIKYALITDVDLIVKMLFDQEVKELEKEYKRVNYQINIINDIDFDLKGYKDYKNKVINEITKFINSIKNHPLYEENYLENKKFTDLFPNSVLKTKHDRGLEVINIANEILSNTESALDKDILALFRRFSVIDQDLRSFYNYYNFYNVVSYYYQYFQEYVSKVAKAEKTILKPKGYDRNSNMQDVLAKLNQDKGALENKANDYKPFNKPETTKRWEELRKEAVDKKSAIAIDGKTPAKIAFEFAKLNKIIGIKQSSKPNTCNVYDLINDKKTIEIQQFSMQSKLDISKAKLKLLQITQR